MSQDPAAAEEELREHVARAWARVSTGIDGLIASGQLVERDVLLDVARFLESAGPALAAYERLLARLEEQGGVARVVALPTSSGECR